MIESVPEPQHISNTIEQGPRGWVHVKRAIDEVGCDRLRREADVLSSLAHPNVVEVESIGPSHLSTRLAGRRSLTELLNDPSPPSRQQVLHLARSLLQVVADVHAFGWIHGKIESDHVILGNDQRLTLCSWRRAARRSGGHPAFAADRDAAAATIANMRLGLASPSTRAEREIDRHLDRLVADLVSGEPAPIVDNVHRTMRRPETDGRLRRTVSAALTSTAATGCILVLARALKESWPRWSGGPTELAIGVLRMVALSGALYVMIASAVLAVATAADATHVATAVLKSCPRPLRKLLAGLIGSGLLSLAVPRPSIPLPVEPPQRAVSAVPPSSGSPIRPATTTVPTTVRPSTPTSTIAPAPPNTLPDTPVRPTPTTSPPADRWRIEPGDHLWRVAEVTVTARTGRAPSERDVARYWRRLIAENRAELLDPANPDLVIVGQVIRLPSS